MPKSNPLGDGALSWYIIEGRVAARLAPAHIFTRACTCSQSIQMPSVWTCQDACHEAVAEPAELWLMLECTINVNLWHCTVSLAKRAMLRVQAHGSLSGSL